MTQGTEQARIAAAGRADRTLLREKFYETVLGTAPSGWVQGYFSIKLTRPDERKPIEAWIKGPFAIHEGAIDDAILSHAPSGCHIATFDTIEQAAECAERIDKLADFSAIQDRVPPGGDLYPRVRAIVDEIRERDND